MTPQLSSMSAEDKRIAIATAAGVNTKHYRFWYKSHGGMKFWEFSNRPDAERTHKHFGEEGHPVLEFTDSDRLPDYLNSLDACHEMEKALSPQDRHAYCIILSELVSMEMGWRDWNDTFKLLHATPETRVSAALLALNLATK